MTRLTFLLTLQALFAIAGEAAAQGTFTGLGAPETYLSDITPDGAIAVGVRSDFGPAFRWTAAGGVMNIGGVGPLARISREGKTIISGFKGWLLIGATAMTPAGK